MAPPSTSRKTRRDLQREATRQRVFQAALEVFRRDGLGAARIEDVASIAGVSRGTFYFHFPTKDAVIVEYLEGAQDEFVAAVDQLPHEAHIEAVLEATSNALSESWNDDPRFMCEVGLFALRSTASGLASGAQPTGIRATLGRRFAQAAERGQLSALVPAQALADFYLSSAFSVAIGWAQNPTQFVLSDGLRAASYLFLDGARAPAAD